MNTKELFSRLEPAEQKLRCEIRDLQELSDAFCETGNERVAQRLEFISNNLCDVREVLEQLAADAKAEQDEEPQ